MCLATLSAEVFIKLLLYWLAQVSVSYSSPSTWHCASVY